MQSEYVFNLGSILRACKRFWLIVLICTLVGGLVGLGYTCLFRSDVYTGSASFWVSSDTGISQSSTLGASQMATNYMELCEQDILLRRAVKDAELDVKWNCTEDAAVQYLRSVTGASKTNAESCIFSVNVRSGDKKMTFESIYALQYAMVDIVDDLSLAEYSGGRVTLVGEVLTESDVYLTKPRYLRNSVISAAAAFVLSVAACVAIEVKNENKLLKSAGEENEEQI